MSCRWRSSWCWDSWTGELRNGLSAVMDVLDLSCMSDSASKVEAHKFVTQEKSHVSWLHPFAIRPQWATTWSGSPKHPEPNLPLLIDIQNKSFHDSESIPNPDPTRGPSMTLLTTWLVPWHRWKSNYLSTIYFFICKYICIYLKCLCYYTKYLPHDASYACNHNALQHFVLH